jgi:hypothetical protein
MAKLTPELVLSQREHDPADAERKPTDNPYVCTTE